MSRKKSPEAYLNVLTGHVMKATGGRADAPAVREEIVRQLAARAELRRPPPVFMIVSGPPVP